MTNETPAILIAVDKAIVALTSEIYKGLKAEDAMKYTQAVLNLAHVQSLLYHLKPPVNQ